MNISSLLSAKGSHLLIEETPVSVDFLQYKVVVVVPSFNEERFIGSVVLKLLRYPVTVIVVDNGSSDATSEVATRAGAVVIRNEHNLGKGAAINAGFVRARELSPDAIVLIDANGQHLPEELPRVVQPVLEGKVDLVVGSRYLKQTSSIPANRALAHLLFSWLTNIASGISVSDTQSGYRAFSPRAFNLDNFRSRSFSVESEMQFMAREQGLRVAEVPITIRYDDPPKRSALRQGMMVLNDILRLSGQYRPLLFFGLPGVFVLLVGIAWGAWVVNIYSQSHQLATGYAMLSVLLSIVGLSMFSTGIILHSVRGLLIDMLKSKES